MMHPHTRLGFVNETVGYGVFVTNFIPKGTIIWVLDELDPKLDEAQINSLDPLLQERVRIYGFRDTIYLDSKGKYLLCWDIGQFVNHSSQPTCLPTPYEFSIASRDIYAGEELTDDYRWYNIDHAFDYLLEDGTARRVKADDLFDCYKILESQAEEAMRCINKVEQPLRSLIKKKYLDKIEAVAEGKEPMDSLLRCYYENSRKEIFKTLSTRPNTRNS
ncbi:SET domain-containing protein-lysine N-methyltransferase [Hydrococcus rivularis NIES-593]|uniref:SET domain-containing protein-lysine N-methyltransferase n=1 Tax=Hydrococcus rivularis NIES-593 TaxID=1921803 RepID=A0A1U7HCU3_9CYAN|nr:SET domain-containing protein [Hydrococcus rivularis]OKH21422.1 SET domain-containing protein-lysine N-methyltransferase [Hydrococcus rivularis NIES-593]